MLFYVFAGLALGSAVMVPVAQRNPMYSAFSLVVTLCSMGALFGLLGSPFIAVLQVIIYAAAIMVLFLFVVMLLNVPREEPLPSAIAGVLGPSGMRMGAVLSVLLGVEMLWALSRLSESTFAPEHADTVSSVANIGRMLFTQHAFAFEVTSVLILVAMVGASFWRGRNTEVWCR